uniref:UDENN FNIP1/2-type domain-containing protein n=1 Tax=Plectus sambesii TaxID=2011161 RepID=A0A914VN19_9BILA
MNDRYSSLLPAHRGARRGQSTVPMVPMERRTGVELHKHMPDVKELGEMIFGSMSMAAKGESLKVHQMRDPKKLMISRVFLEPKVGARPTNPIISENSAVDYTSSDSDSQYSTVRSLDGLMPAECSYARRSIPMDVPDRYYRRTPVGSPVRANSLRRSGRKASLQVATDLSDTECTGSHDLLRSWSTGVFPSTSRDSPTRGSLSRGCRWRLSQATSLSERHDSLTHWMAAGCRSRQTSECANAIEEEVCLPTKKRRRQMGVAVVFTVDAGVNERNNNDVDVCTENYRQFILTHVHLIEMELLSLQAQVQRACLSRERWLTIIHKAWLDFRYSLCTLHDAPRLTTPVWLSLMSAQSDNLAVRFCDVFSRLVDSSNTKLTNFFLSTLLSAVLTHHLSWVSSVAPPISSTKRLSRTRACEMSSTRRSPLIGATTDVETLSMHPYNPFWAQYLDINGAVGFPVRQAKVLVMGEERGLIAELLFVLSYFLRCSEVRTPESAAVNPQNVCDLLDDSSIHSQAEEEDDDDSSTITQTPKRTRSREPVFPFDEATSATAAVDLPQPPKRRQSISNGTSFNAWRRINDGHLAEPAAISMRKRNTSSGDAGTSGERRLTRVRDRDRLTRVQSQSTMWRPKVDGLNATMRKMSLPSAGALIRVRLSDEGCKPPNVCSVDSGIGEQDHAFLQVNKRLPKVVIDASADHHQLFDDTHLDEWVSKDSREVRLGYLQDSTTKWKCEGDLGRSMLAGVCETHCRHFALSGLLKSTTTIDVYASVVDDLHYSLGRDDDCCLTPCSSAASTTSESAAFILAPAEAVCIVADTSDWTVKVLSSSGRDLSLKDSTVPNASEAIATLVERFHDLRTLGAAPDFLLSYIEDALAGLFVKSQALAELLAAESRDSIDTSQLKSVVGCDWSDVPLLMNVAAVHSPDVLSSISCM